MAGSSYQKLRRADCVVVSFGKSGRTWLRVMLSRFYQLQPRPVGASPDRLRQSPSAQCRDSRRSSSPTTTTQGLYRHGDSKIDYAGRKVVLLVRHPADVAVSQYHQWRHRMRPNKAVLNAYPDQEQEVGMFEFVVPSAAGLAKVIDFMNGWAGEVARSGDLLVVRYEDMRRAPGADAEPRSWPSSARPARRRKMPRRSRSPRSRTCSRMEQRRTFWLSGGRMVPQGPQQPELVQDAARQGRRLSRLLQRGRGRRDRADDCGASSRRRSATAGKAAGRPRAPEQPSGPCGAGRLARTGTLRVATRVSVMQPPAASPRSNMDDRAVKHCVFVHTNHRQMVGALVSQHSIQRNSRHNDAFDVRIIDTEEHPVPARRARASSICATACSASG